MIVVLMGVSGAGKTTIGELLARRLGCDFLDADDFHPPQNVAKMAGGTPLTDADREPWLDRLNAELRRRSDAVLACSALKQSYRDRLCEGVARCELVYLRGAFPLIEQRARARVHRYMPATLLQSQFAALEPPERATEIDVSLPIEDCVDQLLEKLR